MELWKLENKCSKEKLFISNKWALIVWSMKGCVFVFHDWNSLGRLGFRISNGLNIGS
jgi:hypothetical protein